MGFGDIPIYFRGTREKRNIAKYFQGTKLFGEQGTGNMEIGNSLLWNKGIWPII